MNVLVQFNAFLAAMLPAPIWVTLEAVLGISIAFATLAQRTMTPRFQSSGITCMGDWITTRAGQIGLAIIGTIAFVIFLDAVTGSEPVPRAAAVLGLLAYFLVQLRVIYLAIVEIWPFRSPRITHPSLGRQRSRR